MIKILVWLSVATVGLGFLFGSHSADGIQLIVCGAIGLIIAGAGCLCHRYAR